MKYSILTPTRSRVEKMKENLVSISTTTISSVKVYVYVDNTDPFIDGYKQLEKESFTRVETHFIYGDAASIGVAWNIMAQQAFAESTDWVLMGNDDIIFQTQGWDQILTAEINQLEDDFYMLWPDDGINQDKYCAFPIISKKWYETLGYFVPEIFIFGCHDTWLFELAKETNRSRYISKILNRHAHHSQPGEHADITTSLQHKKSGTRKQIFERDIATLQSHIPQIKNDASKILDAITQLPKTTIINSDMPDPLLAIIPGDVRHRARNTNRLGDLQKNLEQVRREFIGKPEICHLLVEHIMLLRRKIEVEKNTARFYELLNKYLDVILKNYDTRWLLSICDTIVDVGDHHSRAAAMCVVITVNNLNIQASLLNCVNDGVLNDSKLNSNHKSKNPTWDGMISLDLHRGDTVFNMQTRLKNVLSESELVGKIWDEIKSRLKDIPDIPINRLCAAHRETSKKSFFI